MLNGNETPDYFFRPCRKLPVEVCAVQMHDAFAVHTAYGAQLGKPGDYLIQGVDGELYPCPEAVFEQTYEWVAPTRKGVHKGRFKLDAPQVFSNSPAMAKILGAVKVVDAVHDAITDVIEYTAECYLFDEIPADTTGIPEYHMYLVFEKVVAERVEDKVPSAHPKVAPVFPMGVRSKFVGGSDFSFDFAKNHGHQA